jgi:hypothetical protein
VRKEVPGTDDDAETVPGPATRVKRGNDDRREHAGNIQFVYYHAETIATIAQLRLRLKGGSQCFCRVCG